MTSTGYTLFAAPSNDLKNRAARRFKRTAICRRMLLLFLSIGFLGLGAKSASARDLQGRLGLGYNDEFANSSQTNGVPGISLKYGLSRDLDFEVIFGISTASPTNSVAAVKFFRNLFYETNLNFYYFAGGGEVGANEKTGLEILSGFGAEFFIPGLESLGFSMDVGGDLDNLSGSFALKTIGVSFINAGIHFYF
jgi:hypothetical protein